MKSLAIAPLFAIFLALAVACGPNGPTDVPNPQSADQITKAAQELFADWIEATQKRDGTAFHSLLSASIRDRCTAGQMDQFFTDDTDAFTYPEMAVKEVFLAAGNTDTAFMTMELLAEPGTGQDGAIDAYVASIPYSIVLEDGRWRMVINYIFLEDGCPFGEGSFSTEESIPAESSTPRPPSP